ncbi:protein FAM210B-like, partial [Trifolium medium]|nr:protein FAM210B-like [Trifolium medium]
MNNITSSYLRECHRVIIFSSKEEGEGQKSKGDQAKELLAKYGGAYLATSITLSLISFALCYVLINAGVDVQTLLQK